MQTFPESKRTKQLKDLAVGETCYTLPWGMWVRTDGQCFLNERYPAYEASGGTAQLKVTRVKEGYVVYIYDVDHKWSKQDEPYYASPEENCYGKVVDFGITSYEDLSIEDLQERLQNAIGDENFELAMKIRDIIKGKAG